MDRKPEWICYHGYGRVSLQDYDRERMAFLEFGLVNTHVAINASPHHQDLSVEQLLGGPYFK
jgi:hypothetical protein